MSHVDFLVDRFSASPHTNAILWRGENHTYQWLLEAVAGAEGRLTRYGIAAGDAVCLEADFSPNGIAMFLALIKHECIIVPLLYCHRELNTEKYELSQARHILSVDDGDRVSCCEHFPREAGGNQLYTRIRSLGVPGLVLFTSGTSGTPKVAVHDMSRLLTKFHLRRTSLSTINFLLFDHWGGLNTLLHTLSNTGLVIAIDDRSSDGICSLIEGHGIEVLPTTPTFLNLLLASGAYRRHDLSSLKVISYGTELMPQSTLDRITALLPEVSFKQTYGLIELGVLRSRSKGNSSLWVKIGREGFDTRVVDGVLQIRAESAMLGYSNADSPFTEDGYFITGDSVEVDGDYVKFLGRKDELINVGGEKVYPIEVENVIRSLDNVSNVVVYGEDNLLTGKIVCARVSLVTSEDNRAFARRLKKFCRQELEPFKVPVRVRIEAGDMRSERFKTKRNFS